eukprot:160041-Chlamydomonas_euryale.AAC.8
MKGPWCPCTAATCVNRGCEQVWARLQQAIKSGRMKGRLNTLSRMWAEHLKLDMGHLNAKSNLTPQNGCAPTPKREPCPSINLPALAPSPPARAADGQGH